ncbi:MAG: hypothetical protein WEB37_07095 [Bacteroidota bacterium]
MNMYLFFPFLVFVLSLGLQGAGIDRQLLKGAWTSGGPSFNMVVEDSTILFEFDMKEHPYTLKDSLLTIDFQDSLLGVQTKKILKLTIRELVFRDLESGMTGTYTRMED